MHQRVIYPPDVSSPPRVEVSHSLHDDARGYDSEDGIHVVSAVPERSAF